MKSVSADRLKCRVFKEWASEHDYVTIHDIQYVLPGPNCYERIFVVYTEE